MLITHSIWPVPAAASHTGHHSPPVSPSIHHILLHVPPWLHHPPLSPDYNIIPMSPLITTYPNVSLFTPPVSPWFHHLQCPPDSTISNVPLITPSPKFPWLHQPLCPPDWQAFHQDPQWLKPSTPVWVSHHSFINHDVTMRVRASHRHRDHSYSIYYLSLRTILFMTAQNRKFHMSEYERTQSSALARLFSEELSGVTLREIMPKQFVTYQLFMHIGKCNWQHLGVILLIVGDFMCTSLSLKEEATIVYIPCNLIQQPGHLAAVDWSWEVTCISSLM